MITLISLIAALALAAIPIAIGWRRTVDEAGMARAMGSAQPKKRFDPDKFARQTGTGLSFNQIAYGFLAWVMTLTPIPPSTKGRSTSPGTSCSPCFKRECDIGVRCMQEISVDDVMAQIPI